MIPKLETSPEERPSSFRKAAVLGQVFLLPNKDSAASEERLPRWWADQQATFGATDMIFLKSSLLTLCSQCCLVTCSIRSNMKHDSRIHCLKETWAGELVKGEKEMCCSRVRECWTLSQWQCKSGAKGNRAKPELLQVSNSMYSFQILSATILEFCQALTRNVVHGTEQGRRRSTLGSTNKYTRIQQTIFICQSSLKLTGPTTACFSGSLCSFAKFELCTFYKLS